MIRLGIAVAGIVALIGVTIYAGGLRERENKADRDINTIERFNHAPTTDRTDAGIRELSQ